MLSAVFKFCVLLVASDWWCAQKINVGFVGFRFFGLGKMSVCSNVGIWGYLEIPQSLKTCLSHSTTQQYSWSE